MNTTFTTCAEKKAKQFLNLLQGYTKGIRMTAILILLLTGVTDAWAGHGFFSDDACGIKLNYSGNTTTEIKKNSSGASTHALGTITKLYLKGWWFAAWENTNDFNETESGKLYYRVYLAGSPSGNYTSTTHDYYNWGGWKDGSQNVWLGSDKLNTNILNGLVGGNYIFEYYFTMGSEYLSNGSKNYTISFTYNPTYTVTVNAGTGGSVAKNSIVAGNITEQTLPTATPNMGYSFANWTITNGNLTLRSATSPSTATVKARSVGTVTANFTPAKYTITYRDQNNATFSGSHASGYPTQHTYGTATTLKTATKTGYTFGGWFDNKECTGTAIESLGATAYTANITLYAKWTAHTYVVTLNPQSGTDGTTSVTATYGSAMPAITKPTRIGYTFNGYYDAISGGTQYYKADGSSARTWNKTAATTLYAQWTPDNYTITYNTNGGSGTMTPTSYTIETATFDLPTPTKTGYTFEGWYTASDFSGSKVTQITKGSTGDKAFYALWTANTYTVTLDQTGAASIGTKEVTAHYEADMPTADVTMPTAKIGYAFMGYWDKEDGQGKQYYKADGTSERPWDKTEDATLYAYFEKAQITQITLNKEIFEPVPTGEAYVIATPTIEPDNVGEVIVCWRLLYNDGTPVDGYDAIDIDDNAGNKVQFSIVGLATGSYKIEATLHAGSVCGNGEPLSTLTKNFIIASEYTVTVKYTCDNQEIKASTTAPAQATETTDITAPDIFGYTFKEWTLGDGVSSESTLTEKTISYTAIYDGTITAKYTKRKLIYFKRPADWGTTIYYYNIGSADKWKNNIDGVTWGLYTKDITHGAIKMTRIENSDVYYYDYEATQTNADDPGLYIAFADEEQNGMEPMKNQCHVSWPIEHTRSFNEGTPMFVAANYIHHYWDANYYNAGYWTNYVGETGYTLKIYDKKDGDRKELYSIPFEAATTDNNIPFKAVVDLEAGKTYGFKFVRANGIWYKNDNDGTMTNDSHTDWPFIWDHENGSACGITTTAAGDYTFTLNLNNATGNLQISVDYPAAEGDYRILYRDNGGENWSGNTRPQNWCHPSRIIKKKEDAKDIISFFINHDKNPELQYQTIKSIAAATGKITWNDAQDIRVDWSQIDTSGVYNFVFVQDGEGISLENTIEPYTGNYYIRCDAFGDKWDNYDINPENRMTYSAFSESEANSFGEKFSHYAVEWCPRGTNVKFTIANDYSPCITDTLIRDIEKTWDENMDEHGNLKSDGSEDPTADKYSANIRFMWNRKTNKISRAYLSSATNVTKKFLILQGDEKMADSDGNAIAATTYVPANATLLQDKENWIYETTIKVQPGARVKLYACYTKTAVEDAQYFRGKKGEFNDENTVQILGGEGDTWYTMRVIYDFKTNRLLAAWIPDTQIGDEGLQIDADIMIIREHQEEATCINLTEHTNSKLTEVKTVYGVMRFNRWVLNNRANPDDLDIDHCSTVKNDNRQYDEEKVKQHHPVLPLGDQKSIYERSLYFISFPFDVKVSDIFGFGTYWNEWYIEYYDGLKRAREGFFIDSPPNWKYVTPEMADTFKLRAYQGYILGVDLDYMQYDNTSFWAHNIQEIELFFPSTTTMGEICRTEVVMPALGPEYECKINRPNSDHRVIDSYWRCIGVPSYANYDGLLYTDADKKQSITWKTDYTWKGDYSEFPFLYAWNTTDNTITPHSTTTFKFKTMHSYLVQHKDKIHWSAISTKPSPIVAKERNEATRNYEWKITLSRNEKLNDQTFIRMADREDITTEFDFNQDLSKEFNYGRSDIYTLIGNTKAAANSLPITETTTLIPLGLSIEFNGDYTIAMPDRMENIGVTLIDTESNTRTNLSAGMEYVVTLNKGDYNNRFFIEISPIQQTPTDIEYVTGDSNSSDSIRKVLIDNILYIVRDGQMFDARGARVK